MLKSVAKIISTLALITTVMGCKDIATFTYSPYPDVELVAVAHKVSYHAFEAIPGTSTFVHFKYAITVHSDTPVYFKVEDISVSINGIKSNGTYYDTFASIGPHWQKMKMGENIIEAYVSFPAKIDASVIRDITFISYGLSRETAKDSLSFGNNTHNNAFNTDLRVAARLSAD